MEGPKLLASSTPRSRTRPAPLRLRLAFQLVITLPVTTWEGQPMRLLQANAKRHRSSNNTETTVNVAANSAGVVVDFPN